MSGVISRSDRTGGGETTLSEALAPVRVVGGVHARFRHDGRRTVVASAAERGGYRLAQPMTFGAHLEALQINTGGGVAGGDRIETVYELGRATDVVHTTSSAERIYCSDGAAARLETRLSLEAGARLDWLPQQTLLYAGARLERRIQVDVATDSHLLMVEMTTFGRPESKERAAPASLNDQWRIRREGRLVYAEAVRLSGEFGLVLSEPAIAGGARAAALALLVAPNTADLVEPLRRALESDACESGVSAWNGLLAARALAVSPGDLLAALARAIPVLSGRAVPRAWAV
jgi:urease accessory protein